MSTMDTVQSTKQNNNNNNNNNNIDDEKQAGKDTSNQNDLSSIKPHIYFVIDTTGSMSSYIASLNQVLKQIFGMINILFAGQASLHVISYKDYCDADIISECHNNSEIESFVSTKLQASGGGDAPEAAKTALNNLYKYMTTKTSSSEMNNSIVLVYTDAPPHHNAVHSNEQNIGLERSILATETPGFDWLKICIEFKKLNIPFYTFLSKNIRDETKLFWKMLGELVEMPDTNVNTITQATIGCICQLMGCNNEDEYAYATNFKILQYSVDGNNSIVNDYRQLEKSYENENNCNGLLPVTTKDNIKNFVTSLGSNNVTMAQLKGIKFVSLDSLGFLSNVLKNLPKRLLYDEKFRDLVFGEFKSIITKEKILCLSYNSVFGTIWRHLCRFREDERLKLLKNNFSLIINELNGNDKELMQQWIDESYDDTEEINSIISKHIEMVRKTLNSNDGNNQNTDKNSKNDENPIAATDKTDSKTEDNSNGKKTIRYITLDGIDSDLLPTKKELLTISNSLFGDIIQKVQRVMTHLIVITKDVNEDAPFDDKVTNSYVAIPESLNNCQFFSLLSHLVVNGTMFTLRPSLIMSCIAYLSGNIVLKQRAKELLMENKGKWILLDKLNDFPEFISVPFVKLMVRCNKQMMKDNNGNGILTGQETLFYNNLYKIYRIRISKPKQFELKTGFEPKINEIRPDFKRKCVGCNEFRSFTLMLNDNKCGKCHQVATCEENIDLARNNDENNKSKYSHLVSCRTCQAIYAVIDVAALNVSPKCHYCRELVAYDEIPVINCKQCKNRWILPNPDYFGEKCDKNDWTCPCCVDNDINSSLRSVNIAFEQLVTQFPILLTKLFEVNLNGNSNNEQILLLIKDFFSSMSLYKLFMKYESTAIFNLQKMVTAATSNQNSNDTEEKTSENENNNNANSKDNKNMALVIDQLLNNDSKYKGRIIHNIKELVGNIYETVNYGQLSDICCLCFETKQLLLLESACGKCDNLMCFDCLRDWYDQVKPGHIVLPTHLLCPFCKQRPKINTLKKYNKQMCTIVRSEKKIAKNKEKNDIVYKMELSYKDYFAWCIKCYEIKQALQRECIRNNVPNITNFVCGDCKELEILSATDKILNEHKKCPNCETPTVKVDGCNHISCVCGGHWCYQCGEAFGEDIIYDHMEEEHGGIYDMDY